MLSPREAARFMGKYAKDYGAGAFATPTEEEIRKLQHAGGWHESGGWVVASRTLSRPSVREDFTRRKYLLPTGCTLATHLAHVPGSPIDESFFEQFDYVFSYIEDLEATEVLRRKHFIEAVRVSAASELIACWGDNQYQYSPVDLSTVVELPVKLNDIAKTRILAELKTVEGWCDDYPFYSDGSWDAVSLRGFKPDDPFWGVKPTEMGKSWHAEHPEAADYLQCGWTPMADQCPVITGLVKHVTASWGELERVRLLRMQGRDGRGGSLKRHSDITDPYAGTKDGEIMRFHIPLITDPRVTMTTWDIYGKRTETHLPAWTMWYLDARKPHAVDNKAGIDRIHLVIDVKATETTRQAISFGRLEA